MPAVLMRSGCVKTFDMNTNTIMEIDIMQASSSELKIAHIAAAAS